MTTPLSRRDLLRAVGLVVATLLIWAASTGVWQYEIRRTPPEYRIDGLETLARFELAGEKGLRIFGDQHMTRLGAPFGADWSAYPMSDAPVFLLVGAVSRLVGLAAASHFAVLLAHALGTLVFWFCSRALGHRPLFAGAAALLFSFCHINVARGFDHYSFALTFVVPGTLLAAWLVGCSRTLIEKRIGWLGCLAVAVFTGTATPYFGLMFALLVACACVYQFATARRTVNLVVGLACLGLWGAVFAGCNWHALQAMFVDGRHVLVRSYADSETLALRPVELLMPPRHHRIPAFGDFAEVYLQSLPKRGENLASYLGVVGATGVALAGLGFVRRLVAGRGSLRPAHAPTMLLVVAFAMVGGIAGAMALTVTDVFRAGNRYSIYLLAAALLALSATASRLLRRTHTIGAALLAAAVVAIGLLDQLPSPPKPSQWEPMFQRCEVDRRIGACLREKLPAGSMVFQLPVRPFLEQPPIGAMADYEQFRPFFFSSTTLRFSYGLLAGDPGLVWARRMERLPPAEMKQELEHAGFAAIHVHTTAYADQAAALRSAFLAAGASVCCEESPHLVLRLDPSATPRTPQLAGINRYPEFDELAEGTQRFVLAGDGWYDCERNEHERWRWSGNLAVIVLSNETEVTHEVVVRCVVEAFHGDLEVSLDDGKTLWRRFVERKRTPCEFHLTLPPGETHLHWRFHGATKFAGPDDDRRLGFRVAALHAEVR